MARKTDQVRPILTVSREEARRRIQEHIEKANKVPDVSINRNHEARKWYEYVAEMLRQLFTTDEIADEFTGRSSLVFGDVDISIKSYLIKLVSIQERLDLYPEPPVSVVSVSEKPLKSIELIIKRFHNVVRQLRIRYDSRTTLDVSDEYDTQDLMHALLKMYFEDIRPEEWTPSYAGSSSRMDFLLKEEKIVIEIKKTRQKLGAKEVGEQLSIDIMRYKAHPECNTLVCFVYDPEERIANPRGLERDLTQVVGGLTVKVYIAQK